MIVNINQINLGGLSDEVIKKYQNTSKVKKMIEDIQKGDEMPSILLYPSIKSKYTIADGIHRLSSYLFLNIYEFKAEII